MRISQYIPPQSLTEQWDVPGLEQHLNAELGLKAPVQEWLDAERHVHEEGLRTRILGMS